MLLREEKKMREEVFSKVQELNRLKYLAAKAGRKDAEWLEFVSEEKLGDTELNTGDLAEILVMWMLGIFQRIDSELSVHASPFLDMQGIDIALRRFSGKAADIQLKFNRKNRQAYGKGISVIELRPSSKFTGELYLVGTEPGNSVLLRILTECGVYVDEEVYDLFESEYGFEERLNRAWEWLKN